MDICRQREIVNISLDIGVPGSPPKLLHFQYIQCNNFGGLPGIMHKNFERNTLFIKVSVVIACLGL